MLGKRRTNRLKDYDYSSEGTYFVTVCAHNREHLFSRIKEGKMQLNENGRMIEECWNEISGHFPSVKLDEFIIMPNHIHGIISIVGAGFPRPENDRPKGAVTAPLRTGSLGQIIAYFKYQSTKRINLLRGMPGIPVWQRNYYERIIRNESELFQMRQYIQENPLKWDLDPENINSSAEALA
jgi:REP element-mobilizing transposase RayT